MKVGKADADTKSRPARSGRLSGRNAYQAGRRQKTKVAILTAASKAFQSRSYFNTTVEDILELADISRATFYMHFESKLAVAEAVFEEAIPDWFEVFDNLPAIDPNNFDELKKWTAELTRVNVKYRDLAFFFYQLAMSEEAFLKKAHVTRDHLIERMAAAGLNNFAGAQKKSMKGFELKARINLLLLRLDEIGRMAAWAETILTPDIDFYVDVTARELQDILRTVD